MSNPSEQRVEIGVSSEFLPDQSNPESHRYVFSYTVTIRNVGHRGARLLSRHWIITDANGKAQEVQGEGVVGETPFLQPGEEFKYSSGTYLETPVGSMQGSYGMVTEDGEHFQADISPFSLAVRGLIH